MTITRKTDFLDGFRGLAALYVLIGHARMLLWEGYADGFLKHPDSYNMLSKFFVYFFSLFIYGHEVVIFFFVLSGFVIHLKYSKWKSDLILEKSDLFQYLKNRARRIYPPLLLALVLTYVLDLVGNAYFSAPYIDLTPSSLINSAITNYHNKSTLIGNILFLMNTYTPIWGTNGPLWSLKYEWWFYMFYPIFLFINKRSIGLALTVIVVLNIVTYLPISWPVLLLKQIFEYMICWWLGTILADIYNKRTKIKFSYLIPLLLLIPFLIFYTDFSYKFKDTVWALGFTGLIALCFYLKEKGYSLSFIEKFKSIGDFSYSVYIFHAPIMVLMCGIILRFNQNKLPQHFGYVFVGIMISIVLTYLLHFIVERPFVRKAKTDIAKTI